MHETVWSRLDVSIKRTDLIQRHHWKLRQTNLLHRSLRISKNFPPVEVMSIRQHIFHQFLNCLIIVFGPYLLQWNYIVVIVFGQEITNCLNARMPIFWYIRNAPVSEARSIMKQLVVVAHGIDPSPVKQHHIVINCTRTEIKKEKNKLTKNQYSLRAVLSSASNQFLTIRSLEQPNIEIIAALAFVNGKSNCHINQQKATKNCEKNCSGVLPNIQC